MMNCDRCGTNELGVRLGGFCVWCYAVQRTRPDDTADAYGQVVEA